MVNQKNRLSRERTTASIFYILLALIPVAPCDDVRGVETNEVPHVGHLREFDHFTFKGADSFSHWALWFGLNSTFDFPEESHPLAPRDEFLEAIASQLHLGYQHCGFPDARVSATYDPKKDEVVVQIREGRRYLCGPVEVIGAHQIPVQPIIRALSVTNVPDEPLRQPFQFLDNAPANRTSGTDAGDLTNQDFLWVAGQPAHFDSISLHYLAAVVTNALGRQGFLLSRFSINIVPEASTKTAALQVRILEEGPPATVGRIEVAGNRRNSRDVLLNYLNLKPGMEFTSDLPAAINDRLYHSARFLTNSISVSADSAGRVALNVNVVENDECPPLDRAFSPTEQTMLMTRDWLAQTAEGPEDAVLTFSGYPDDATSLRFVFSPRQGLLILENDAGSVSNQFDHALIMSRDQFALYDFESHQEFVAPHPLTQFKVWLSVETHAPAESGNCVDLTFGAGTENLNNATNGPPFAFSISLAPAAFVRLAHSTNSICWLDGGQLIRSNADSVLKLDTQTGRFIDLIVRSDERPHARLDLRFQPDAFALAAERIDQDGAGYENEYDTNSPLGSAVSFLGSEVVKSKFVAPLLRARLPAVTCAELPAMLHKLGSGGFFASFKSLKDFETPPDGPAGPFQIPEEPRSHAGGQFAEWMGEIAQGIFQGGDKILPVNSWPWTVARELAFMSRNQTRYLLPDLVGIYKSDDCGPIGCLVTASMLKASKSPVAKAMAEQGLQRLSATDFQHDCRLFLDEQTFCGRFAAALAGTLRNLNDQELDALAAPLPLAHAQFIRACATRLHEAKPDQSLADTLAPVLNDYWEQSLNEHVAAQLQWLANE